MMLESEIHGGHLWLQGCWNRKRMTEAREHTEAITTQVLAMSPPAPVLLLILNARLYGNR